jgi:osmotically-inducible protein OsmY
MSRIGFNTGENQEESKGLFHEVQNDVQVLTELQDRLKAAFLNDVQVTLDDGVVRLTGTVPDLMARRHALAIARSAVRDVLDVREALDVDTASVSRVTAALLSDPRTEASVVRVNEEEGVVTLEGQVGSRRVRETAEEIAHDQSDTLAVINALEVKSDKK